MMYWTFLYIVVSIHFLNITHHVWISLPILAVHVRAHFSLYESWFEFVSRTYLGIKNQLKLSWRRKWVDAVTKNIFNSTCLVRHTQLITLLMYCFLLKKYLKFYMFLWYHWPVSQLAQLQLVG